MKSILVIVVSFCSVLGLPHPQYRRPHRALVGPFHPTQLPPIRAEEAADQDSYEARSYQTGYRLQNTGYRPLPEPQSQDYGQYRGPSVDYRPQTPVDYRSQTPKDVVPILTYSNDVAFDGSYNYNFESADGISRQESAVMTNPGTEDESPSVQGSYSYTAPDGTLITVNYIADKEGFRAVGDHIPTPPPIPEAIAKSLEYIARVRSSQPAGFEDDGQYKTDSQYEPERPFRKQNLYSS